MTRAAWFIGAIALAAAGGSMLAGSAVEQVAFPHDKHARLFPVCEGCHGGVLTETDEIFPAAADCTRCHDGTRVDAVEWQPRTMRASNLRFSHAAHVEMTTRAGAPVACRTCHESGGAPARMSVTAADPVRCIGCHEHEAVAHLADAAQCNRCHVALWTAAALPTDRIARFPKPDWHLDSNYISTHAERAREVSCAICHARDTCERCHANADQIPAIVALQRDARVAALELGRRAAYPRPLSHDADWATAHGGDARAAAASCANCHTAPSCTGCHRDGNDVVASLPAPRAGAAGGVAVRRSVHTADVATRHGSSAAAGQLECARCHTADTCARCHAGAESRAFHLPNFAERHATDVFAGSSDCQSCHNTETFCRSCHTRAGVAAQARMSAAFHTAQPLWVLTHGQAARTGMEACASCHRQNDCMRCHSVSGGWGVNPHGPGFDGARAAARNAATCRWCHLSNPVGG